jgi:hypothetical protein
MSNYLNHLVVRNLNLVQTVQPRLPSRFEMPTALGKATKEQVPDGKEGAVTPAISESSRQVTNGEQSTISAFSDEAMQETGSLQSNVSESPNMTSLEPFSQPVTEERGTRDEKVEWSREDRRISPFLPAFSDSEGEKEETSDRGQQNPIARSRRFVERTSEDNLSESKFVLPSSENLASKTVSEEQPFLPGHGPEQKNPPSNPNITAQPKPSNPEREEIQPIAPLVASTNAPPAITFPAEKLLSSTTVSPQSSVDSSRETPPKEPVQLNSPFNPPRSNAIAPPLPTQPPPTIQVTIGRIEVRATPPPTTPKRQRPAPPKMNLNEYLRQQKPGGRS